MKYREIVPNAALRQHIACFWTISSEGASAPPDAGSILPDGSLELVLNFADPVLRRGGNSSATDRLQRMVVGQMDRPNGVRYTGKVDLLGVRFQPAGARAFFPCPLSELSGQIHRLDSVVSRLDKTLATSLVPELPCGQRVHRLEEILLEHRWLARGRDSEIDQAVRAIQKAHGQVSVSALMRHSGVSARQLERRFREGVGLTPKLLARILRFQHAYQLAAETCTINWPALALRCGYYDQAHFIRDFRAFSGATPTETFAQTASASV